MPLSLDYINAICTDLGGTTTHKLNINGINEICTLLSGVGGHKLEIDGLNEICTLNGKTAGHKLNIDALSAIGEATFKTNYDAWKSIHDGTNVNQTVAAFSLLSSGTITDVGATVAGTVDNGKLSTVWSIEYGLTTAYGSTAAGGTITDITAITKALTGLIPFATYHWRIKAVNPKGTSYSADQTLITLEPVILGSADAYFWGKGYDAPSKHITNGKIVLFDDKSASGNNLVPTGVNFGPTDVDNSVYFSGGAAIALFKAFTLAQPYIAFAVMKLPTTVNGDVIWDGMSVFGGALIEKATANFLSIAAGAYIPNDQLIETNKYFIVTALYNGANSRFQINNLPSSIGNAGTNSPGGLTIGARADLNSTAELYLKEYGGIKLADANADLSYIYNYLKNRHSIETKNGNIVIIGDSTIGVWTTMPSVNSLMDNDTYTVRDLSVSGATIQTQKTAWNGITHRKSDYSVVFVQIGLNNVNTENSATAIANYQDLITTIRAGIGANNKIILSTMIPGTYSSYQAWVDLNNAIRGLGATPITGANGFIDTCATALNAGDNTLALAYRADVGLHENQDGRQIIADLFDAKLDELGI